MDYSLWLGEDEEIICEHCRLFDYHVPDPGQEKTESEETIYDFSNYNFEEKRGIVTITSYDPYIPVAALDFYPDCMVAFNNTTHEFFWWITGVIYMEENSSDEIC